MSHTSLCALTTGATGTAALHTAWLGAYGLAAMFTLLALTHGACWRHFVRGK